MSAANNRRGRGSRDAVAYRMRRLRDQAMKPPLAIPDGDGHARTPQSDAVVDCGWGRLLFGQTFADPKVLAAALAEEGPDRRDIAVYVRDPHVLLASAPQALFLDPSHTFRLDLCAQRAAPRPARGFVVRRFGSQQDAEAVNRIYASRGMVGVPAEFFWAHRDSRTLVHLVAEDETTGAVIGTVTGIDHARAFGDPEGGSSLWCLAVDPQAAPPGVGEALVRQLSEQFQARGALFMDLSVLHDNAEAIALYEKIGFVRMPFFSVKRKNPINEKLFLGAQPSEAGLNPYARLLVDEARRRGITVEVTDAEGGFFRLTHGGRTVACRESLSELTTAVAMSICDDKAVTRRFVARAGVTVPEQIEAGDVAALEAFLARHGQVVVKPARGEQGRGVAVGLETAEALHAAVKQARQYCDRVLVEQCVPGSDLRLVVIDFRMVAAAIRRPARVVGDGRRDVRMLIERQSRRRAAATGGESRIPIDAETRRCLAQQGLTLESVPAAGIELQVRRTANLHTGGTIHDVTDEVHPMLVAAAVRAARAIDIPVTGIDFMVRSPREPDYFFVEANERPGLANHEPQPTAERFIDLLFPQSMPASVRRVTTG